MTKWQYYTADIEGADLDFYGQKGWKLVSVDNGVAYFERAIVTETLKEWPDQYMTIKDFEEAIKRVKKYD